MNRVFYLSSHVEITKPLDVNSFESACQWQLKITDVTIEIVSPCKKSPSLISSDDVPREIATFQSIHRVSVNSLWRCQISNSSIEVTQTVSEAVKLRARNIVDQLIKSLKNENLRKSNFWEEKKNQNEKAGYAVLVYLYRID